jgi:hypothetical protein
MTRKWFARLGFLVGIGAGTFFYRRGAAKKRERVDLYFDDGSMVSLADGSPGADRLLPLARSILGTASRVQ